MVRILGPLLAGLIVGLVLGAGGLWLLGDGANGPLLASPDSSNGSSRFSGNHNARADASSDGNAALPAPVAAERAVAREESGAPLPRQIAESVTALAHAVPTPKVERGAKTITGHVTDPQGRPLAAVAVRAARQKERRPERAKRGEELVALPTLEQRLRDAVTAHYQALADQRETTSDDDGAWRIDGLQEGDWRVSAGKAGFAFTTARDLVKPDAVVDFRAALVVRVPMSVKLADGTTPDEVAIVFVGDRQHGRRFEAWRAETPWLALEPGSYELKATLGDLETGPTWPGLLASDSQLVNVRADAAAAEIAFTLKGSPGITGHVKLAASDVEDGVNVKLLLLQNGKEPDLNLLVGSNKQAHADPRDGAYVFKDLPPGRYLVGALRGWQAPLFAHAAVVVADSMVTQDLVVPALERSQCIVAKLLTPEGLPLDKADFSLVYHNQNGQNAGENDGQNENEWSNTVFAARRGTGIWWVVLPRGEGDGNQGQATANMRLELEAKSAQFGSKRVDVAGPGSEVEIRFGDPATLVVTIPGYVGSGFEGRVHLAVEHANSNGNRNYYGNEENALGPEGKQSFGPLEAGACRIAMTIQADGNNWWQAMRVGHVDLTLRPGENTALFPIPALYTVVIEVPGAANGGVQLQRRDANDRNDGESDNGGGNAQIDAQGHATFSGLPAGDYVAQVWSGDISGEMRVRVPSGGVIRFQQRVNDCLEVWVNDEKGKLARAGFKSGDKVVAIAGSPLRNVKDDLEAIVAANATKETVGFTVLREGKTVELSFDVKAMLTPEISGGGFNPATRD